MTTHEATQGRPATDRAPVRDLTPVLSAVASGDLAAFAYLYDTLAPIVHGIARRVLGDPALAADVTQDVMLEMWRDAELYVPERGSVRAWAAEAAHRRAVDLLRDRGDTSPRGWPRPQDGGGEPARPGEWAVEPSTVGTRDCLRSLPEDERSTLLLTYYEGRTYADVAEELQVPPTAVATRLATALRHLTRCLGAG